MAAGTRRLPEDSVVTSLSEIQTILQGERPAAAAATVVDLVVPPRPATSPEMPLGAVPSMAEVRASREQRWREEMQAAKPAQPAESGVPFAVWLGGALALAAGAVLAIALWPETGAVSGELSSASLAPAITTAAPAAVVPPAPVSTAAAPPPEPPSEKVAADPERPRKRTGTRTRRNDSLDAIFGSRRASSDDKGLAVRKGPKKKRTRADSQLDAVLNRL